MTYEEKIDYNEEIDYIFPICLDLKFEKSYNIYCHQIKKNIQYSIFEKKMISLLDDSWILFVFLNLINSFKKKISVKQDSENFIENTYVSSQLIFWKNVESLKNFLIILGVEIKNIILTKIAIFTQISLKILIDNDIILEKKNFVKTPKTFDSSEFFNKSVITYKLNLDVKTKKSFNVENKFFRSPLKIIEYNHPIKKENNFLIKTIITGPTYLRSEVYDKSNPFGFEPFRMKDKKLREIFSETKFYPDIDFINHLKKKFYINLNTQEIEDEIEILRKEFEKTFEIINWEEEIQKKRSSIQKKYSKLLEDLKISTFLNHNWEEYYHLSSNNDYRGRKYYCSPLTFTHFKMSRFCFHYGENGELLKPYFDWREYLKIIKKTSDRNLKEGEEEIIGFYLIGIGKLNDYRKKEMETSLEKILELGLEMFKKEENEIYNKIKDNWTNISLKDKIDAIEYECYKFGLNNFLQGDMKKRIIIKDATASGYQIQTYLIGVEDEKKLKCVNLGEKNIFVDTYIFIANSFNNSGNGFKIPEWGKKYFERSIIKKFCMIIPYSAGFEECFSKIEKNIKEEDIKKASLIFSMFYEFIKKDLWKEMGLKQSFKTYIQEYAKSRQIKDENYYAESETGIANLTYFKTEKKEYDTKYINKIGEKTRTTRAYLQPTKNVDKKKTLTALSPNFTHFHDSDIVRILHLDPYNLKFASIHDAFIISSFECGKLTYSYGSIFKIKIRFKHEIPITCIM